MVNLLENGKPSLSDKAKPQGMDMDEIQGKWVCLKMVSVPLNPMVLLIIIPIKWLFHWEYTQHFQTNPNEADRIGQIHWVEFPNESTLNLYVHQCQTWLVARSQTMLYRSIQHKAPIKREQNTDIHRLMPRACKHIQHLGIRL